MILKWQFRNNDSLHKFLTIPIKNTKCRHILGIKIVMFNFNKIEKD